MPECQPKLAKSYPAFHAEYQDLGQVEATEGVGFKYAGVSLQN